MYLGGLTIDINKNICNRLLLSKKLFVLQASLQTMQLRPSSVLQDQNSNTLSATHCTRV